MRVLVFLLIGLLWWMPAEAACTGSSPTRTAASLADTDVIACITAAANGDTIFVPAGNVTWSTSVTNQGKYFTLQGAGIGSSVVTDGVTTDNPGAVSMIRLTLNAAGVTRITGFTFIGRAFTGPGMLSTGPPSLAAQIRLDHNRWEPNKSPALQFFGCPNGVVDHSVFALIDNGGYAFYTKNGFGCLTGNDDWGDEGWSDGSIFGTSKAVIFEDNQFSAPPGASVWVGDGFAAGRYIFRFNTVTETNGLTGHGIESGGRYRGHRHAECYGNVFSRSGVVYPSVCSVTSGTGVAFDNVVTGTFTGIGNFQNYRNGALSSFFQLWSVSRDRSVSSITRVGTTATVTTPGGHNLNFGGFTTWIRITGATGADATLYNGHFSAANVDSTHFTYTMTGTPTASATGTLVMNIPWDGNTDSTGYPQLDQPGYGTGDELNNVYNASPVPTYPATGLHQTSQPWYTWNNLLNGVLTGYTSVSADAVVENRDFYNQNPNYASVPTTGMGVGARNLRPLNCTIGTAWFSTDQGSWNKSSLNPYGVQRNGADGVLDRCTSTNTWTNAFYTPNVYPHALQGAADTTPPSVPTGVTVTKMER